ncbi:flagellar basal body protein [Asticcacaulis solisilvae]|uniref:flagellar basal body protein n=1 Tax=Asticcacaulis solisilvae TaxID=1217274 RepID=UPI003FD74879
MTTGISLLDALQNRMGWLSGRQKVVAENVANASTPGFKPHDLQAQDFGQLMAGGSDAGGQMGMMVTNAMHIQMQNPLPSGAKEITAPDSETTMDGNSVVMEEQMLKMSESRQQFEAAVGFYEKSMSLVRMAIKAPGK